MNQKQSEDFDSTVRKLAEEAESAYQAHSWTLMEKLLNDKKNKKRLAFWYWPLGALGLIALTWFGYSYFNSSKQEKIENQIKFIPAANSNLDLSYLYALTITADRAFDLNDNPELNNSTPKESNHISSSNENSKKIKTSLVSSNVVTTDKLRNLKRLKSNTDLSAKTNDKIIFSTQHPEPIDNPLANHPSKSESLNQSVETNLISSQVEKTDRSIQISPLSNHDLLLDNTRKINLKEWPDEELSKKPTKHSRSTLILNVGWSPEYTAVVKRSVGKLGNTYGFNVGFRLNKWSISAGIQKSSKNYNAKKEDYLIEERNYYKYLTFVNIQGDCNVLQVPLTLGYNILSTKQIILQLNASVSSLRMDKEKYVYDYFHQNWKPGHDTHDYSYKNWHWLAAASAGIGIQKSFAKNWSVSINPYYQLPLKGIGKGKVNLQSFGSQIGVNWNLPIGK